MASRSATLAKPKVKQKAINKSSSVKSSDGKNSGVAKAQAKSVVKAISKAQANAPIAKSMDSKSNSLKPTKTTFHKAETIKAPILKSVVSKSAESKAPASLGVNSLSVGSASFESTATKPRRRKGEIRTRIYWAVFNQALRRVAVFEFDQKIEAEKRAAKLAKSSGEHHFIQKIKAIVQ